jgi:LysM repeat protein
MSTMTLNATRQLATVQLGTVQLGTAQLATVRELRPAASRPPVGAPSRAQAHGQAQDQGQVRLTRRGRVVVFVAALFLVLLAGVLLGGMSVATDEAGTPAPTEIVVVDEGDTLWGIAAAIADDGDVRSVMSEIETLNALDSSVVSLGQKLRVPVAD